MKNVLRNMVDMETSYISNDYVCKISEITYLKRLIFIFNKK